MDAIIFRALKIQKAATAIVDEVCDGIVVPAPTVSDIMRESRANSAAAKPSAASWAPVPSGTHAVVVAEVRCSLLSRAAVDARLMQAMALLGCVDEESRMQCDMQAAALSIRHGLIINIVLPEAVFAAAVKVVRSRLIARPEMREEGRCHDSSPPRRRSALRPLQALQFELELPAGEDTGVSFALEDAYPTVVAFHTANSLEVAIARDALRYQPAS